MENIARGIGSPRRSRARGPFRAALAHLGVPEALHAVEQISEPGAAAHIHVEAHLAVADVVETGPALVRDQRCDGVVVLLAIGEIAAHRREEGAPAQVLHEPQRTRQRAGDGCGQW